MLGTDPTLKPNGDFEQWGFLSDAMMENLPVFEHMKQQRDLDYKMRKLVQNHLRDKHLKEKAAIKLLEKKEEDRLIAEIEKKISSDSF